MLDVLVAFTTVSDSCNGSEVSSKQEYREAELAAAQLLVNINAGVFHLRKEKVIVDINRTLLPIVQDDDRDAPSYLIGNEFAK